MAHSDPMNDHLLALTRKMIVFALNYRCAYTHEMVGDGGFVVQHKHMRMLFVAVSISN